ncbi:hypothetical protein KP833_003021 [Escherichia coli]|nr:hypothetical protein [Escherichia coli]
MTIEERLNNIELNQTLLDQRLSDLELKDVDINEPDGPTNLSAWMRLKNKELPPSVHNY